MGTMPGAFLRPVMCVFGTTGSSLTGTLGERYTASSVTAHFRAL